MVAVKKDSSDYVPSGFKNSFRSDSACFVAKYIPSINIAWGIRKELKISQDELSHKNSNRF